MTSYLVRNRGTHGGRALARALGIKCTRRTGTRLRPRARDCLINWGCTPETWPLEAAQPAAVINNPEAVQRATHKLDAFRAMQREEVPTVSWTDSIEEARGWQERGSVVLGRSLLRGSAGRGIVVYQTGEQITQQPLYTRYFKSKAEYRLHVVGGEVIDLQQKKLREGFEDPNFQVRVHENGWVFCREGVAVRADARAAAIAAVASLGLDFGAVDLRVSEKGTIGIMEVNTAPGLEGTTLKRYARAFRRYI